MKPVLVLALNPCIDAELRVEGLRLHEKNLVLEERRWAGGKGVNVVRWLKHLGTPACLLITLGGITGRELARNLQREHLASRIIRITEPTRTNVLVSAPDGSQMRFNGKGPKLAAREWRQCLAAAEQEMRRAGWLVLSGSLPPGVPGGAYAGLIRAARRAGLRTFLDCDGPALAAGIRARPFLVKPNEVELAQWAGRPLRSDREVAGAARQMSHVTCGWILVSRGAKGALLINEGKSFAQSLRSSPVRAVNTLGAGDAMLAAVVAAVIAGEAPERWLRSGMKAGAATVRRAPGNLPKRLTSVGRRVSTPSSIRS